MTQHHHTGLISRPHHYHGPPPRYQHPPAVTTSGQRQNTGHTNVYTVSQPKSNVSFVPEEVAHLDGSSPTSLDMNSNHVKSQQQHVSTIKINPTLNRQGTFTKPVENGQHQNSGGSSGNNIRRPLTSAEKRLQQNNNNNGYIMGNGTAATRKGNNMTFGTRIPKPCFGSFVTYKNKALLLLLTLPFNKQTSRDNYAGACFKASPFPSPSSCMNQNVSVVVCVQP